MPMIHGVHLKNFANHRDTKLFLPRLTALVGENGAGKSNVMRAIQFASQAAKTSVVQLPQATCRFGADKVTIAMSGSGDHEGVSGRWGLVIAASQETDNTARVKWRWRPNKSSEECEKWIPEDTQLPSYESMEGDSIFEKIQRQLEADEASEILNLDKSPKEAREFLRRTQYFRALSENLCKPSYPDRLPTVLSSDGNNLPSTLALLMTSDRTRFGLILNALRQVVPAVKDIKSDRVLISRSRRQSVTVNKRSVEYDEDETVLADQLIFDMASGCGIRAERVSEGTLLTLGLLTLLHSEPAPNLVLLDDVERGLHPKAQRELMRQLRDILALRPNLQIVISSHSPYIIDHLKPEEVWLFAADNEGCAVTRRLADHPNAQKALEVLTTGEFWSAEGENWIVDEAKKDAAQKSK